MRQDLKILWYSLNENGSITDFGAVLHAKMDNEPIQFQTITGV